MAINFNLVLVNKKTNARVIFNQNHYPQSWGETSPASSKRRIQVHDDSATFRTVDMADLSENDFLDRIKECLLKGYTVDEGK